MSRRWVTQSYAKINLGLHVLERLPNGYHILETGFCFIEWSDRIEMRPAAQMELHMSEPTIPVDDSNLIVKALQLLQEYAGLRDLTNTMFRWTSAFRPAPASAAGVRMRQRCCGW